MQKEGLNHTHKFLQSALIRWVIMGNPESHVYRYKVISFAFPCVSSNYIHLHKYTCSLRQWFSSVLNGTYCKYCYQFGNRRSRPVTSFKDITQLSQNPTEECHPAIDTLGITWSLQLYRRHWLQKKSKQVVLLSLRDLKPRETGHVLSTRTWL